MTILYWAAIAFTCGCTVGFAAAPIAYWFEQRSEHQDRKVWRKMGGGRL